MKRNRLHSICPYFAMFPEQFVRKHIVAHTDPGDVVFDPFAGRGTTVLESLLLDRGGFGTDLNPVAVCLSNAKADPPSESALMKRLRELEGAVTQANVEMPVDPFFTLCFHEETFRQLLYLRSALDWRGNPIDCFIAAVALGCLHGESHKTLNCFSNRMPRTISTKKTYSVDWWTKHGFTPPRREVFEILRTMTAFRLATPLPVRRGAVVEADARIASQRFERIERRVSLVVTSPPYLDMTDYSEDQWLRLWFLGGAAAPKRGSGDDRHRSADKYWAFLTEAWAGLSSLLSPGAVMVVRIGGTRLSFADAKEKLLLSLQGGLDEHIQPLDEGFCTEIVGRQTNVFRPGTSGQRLEFDFRYRLAA